MMKVVHLCLSCFYIDNYSYQENLLPKYHIKMGYDVTVVASLFSYNDMGQPCFLNGTTEYMDKNGYKVVRLDYRAPKRIYRILRGYVGLYETLEKEKPDIIFSHGLAMSDASVLARYLILHPSVKMYADSHADYINSARNILSKYILNKIIRRHYAKILEPFIEKCFGVTPLRCEFLKEMYDIAPSKIAFLPMGVDDEAIPQDRKTIRSQIRKELNIPQNSFVIITGGKIDAKKNIHILLESLKYINKQSIHLIICGVLTPEMTHLTHSFNDNIHYLGWCNAEKVINCMVASDMACFPGTHSTLWEQAVGIGLPAIFKYWRGMSHVNVCDNCVFVAGENVEEIATQILRICQLDNYHVIKGNALKAAESFLYSNIAKVAIGIVNTTKYDD